MICDAVQYTEVKRLPILEFRAESDLDEAIRIRPNGALGLVGRARMYREAVKALLVTTEFLEAEIVELQAAVSNGYARGKFEPVPRGRKDWYD